MTVTLGGTAQSGTSTTIVLASAVSLPDDTLNGQMIALTAGTGISQVRLITDFVGSTDTCTITPAWITTPSSDSVYEIEGGSVSVEAWLGATVFAPTAGIPSVNTFAINNSSGAVANMERYWQDIDFDQDIASATSTTAVLNSGDTNDDFYNGMTIQVWGGTGRGQARTITDYVGSTKTCTISPPWGEDPASDSDILIIPGPGVPDTNVAQWLGTAAATPTIAGVPEVDITHLDGSAIAAANWRLWMALSATDADITSATSTTVTTSITGFGDDAIIGWTLLVYGGEGQHQARRISDYVSSTGVITVSRAFDIPLDTTSDVLVMPWLSDVNVENVADAVLDELLSEHTIAGSLSQAIADVETDTSNDDNTYEVG